MSDPSKVNNFRRAFRKLKEFTAKEVEDDRDRAGIVQAFEFTYEQAWLLFQWIAKENGLEARSPRKSVQRAFEMGYVNVEDEEWWLQMQEDRNVTSHIYNEELANEICRRVVDHYVPVFDKLDMKLAQEYSGAD